MQCNRLDSSEVRNPISGWKSQRSFSGLSVLLLWCSLFFFCGAFCSSVGVIIRVGKPHGSKAFCEMKSHGM